MKKLFLSLALLCASFYVTAAPGAHGPNGEHLDTPPGTQAGSAHASPRFESATETFELVGYLYDDELSVLVDRFETNEPVRNAKVEVELNGITAAAQFHADHGDYSFTDAALLKALSQPGKHALLFTIFAGKDTDLADGTLEVGLGDAVQDHGHASAWRWVGGAALLILLLAGSAWLIRRSKGTGK